VGAAIARCWARPPIAEFAACLTTAVSRRRTLPNKALLVDTSVFPAGK